MYIPDFRVLYILSSLHHALQRILDNVKYIVNVK